MLSSSPESPAVSPARHPANGSPPRSRRRFVCVGTGGRARMFLDPIAGRFSSDAELVGLCDLSLVRASYHRDRLQQQFGYPGVPVYPARDFRRMLAETQPDQVIVCTIDREHDFYIQESLRAGLDVVTEKPMTIDEGRCGRILQAVRETGRRVRVAFNYRWAPGATKVRELLAAGTVGRIWQVNMEYLLNTRHGADYFRRWHSNKEDSGGLLIHKSTHHFDLINWWIDAIPDTVFAMGGLHFYGRKNALRRGDSKYAGYPRYHGHATAGDPFACDLAASQDDENLYLRAESESGYIRDQNVFRDNITIEDVMHVMVRYRQDTLLNYTLNAFSPYEGYRVSFTGDRGRLEYEEWHGAHRTDDDGQAAVNEHLHQGGHLLRVCPHFRASYTVDIPTGQGEHGGADPLLQEQIFSAHPPADPFGRSAGHEQGAASILVGVAANRSMTTGLPVRIADLVPLRSEAIRLSELV